MLSNMPAVTLRPSAAEDAEELLGAVADEEQSHHQTKNKQCEVHVESPRESGSKSLSTIVAYANNS